MDGRDLSRRPYQQPGYSSAQPYGPTVRSTTGIEGSDRYATRPPSQPLQPYGTHYGMQGAGPYRQQMQESPYSYGEFGTQEQQRPSQLSTFPSSNMVLSVGSQLSQQSSFGEQLPAFQTRGPTNFEALAQLNLPGQQYYNTEAPSISAQAYTSTTPYQTQQGLYRPTTREPRHSTTSEMSPYQTEVAEYAHLAMSNPAEQQQQQQQQQAQRGGEQQAQSGGTGEADYAGFLEALKQTYQDVVEGRLVDAGGRLLTLSEWLLTHAADLGLTHDDQEQQARRFRLWADFNHSWLAVLQKQKDMTLAMMHNGQALPPAQSMLQEDLLERMGRELVAMCDALERHGLVDYQMGVWEEEIMNVLLECLQLLEPVEEPAANVPPGSHAPR